MQQQLKGVWRKKRKRIHPDSRAVYCGWWLMAYVVFRRVLWCCAVVCVACCVVLCVVVCIVVQIVEVNLNTHLPGHADSSKHMPGCKACGWVFG